MDTSFNKIMEEAPAPTLKALGQPYFVVSGAIKTLYFPVRPTRQIYLASHVI